ncbi:hypothetical protein GP2_003_00190 [Gordonia paraffinivorans NBRC 108238]|uniref:Uncharacterized protein n=1 Tax=Gordonia paraffinivorans NBRC 108238 TaxID=1223543 RepID=A0ABQ0IG16_9ACTN|nr:hypothetical protein GP2_003_00190 [Gordonia paraffinivorans NBRC 108238]
MAGTFTFMWSAENGIDLHSRAAEVIRAQVESCALSLYGADAVYPGAEEAALDADIRSSANCVRPHYRPLRSGYAFQGTIHAHVVSVESTGTSISAHVCETRTGRARLDPDNPHLDGTPEFDVLDGTAGIRIVAQKPADVADTRAGAVRIAQPGTGNREPRYNVFHPWVFPPFVLPTTKPPAGNLTSDPICESWVAQALNRVPAFAGQNPFYPHRRLRFLTPKALAPKDSRHCPSTRSGPNPSAEWHRSIAVARHNSRHSPEPPGDGLLQETRGTIRLDDRGAHGCAANPARADRAVGDVVRASPPPRATPRCSRRIAVTQSPPGFAHSDSTIVASLRDSAQDRTAETRGRPRVASATTLESRS